MSKKKKVAVGLVALLVALQLVPVDRTNPAVTGEVPAPDDVRALLRAACYDCHSNETVWPWYTRVAPVSLLAAHDVEEGREYVNFSEWDRLDAAGRQHAYEEVVEVLEGAALEQEATEEESAGAEPGATEEAGQPGEPEPAEGIPPPDEEQPEPGPRGDPEQQRTGSATPDGNSPPVRLAPGPVGTHDLPLDRGVEQSGSSSGS